MDRKAIVQGLYKKLKIREIATLSKCGLGDSFGSLNRRKTAL